MANSNKAKYSYAGLFVTNLSNGKYDIWGLIIPSKENERYAVVKISRLIFSHKLLFEHIKPGNQFRLFLNSNGDAVLASKYENEDYKKPEKESIEKEIALTEYEIKSSAQQIIDLFDQPAVVSSSVRTLEKKHLLLKHLYKAKVLIECMNLKGYKF